MGDAVLALRRDDLTEDGADERIGHLDQHAGAVTGVGVRAGCPAMLEILEDRQCVDDRRVGRVAAQIRDHAYSACVVFESWVVKVSSHGVCSGQR